MCFKSCCGGGGGSPRRRSPLSTPRRRRSSPSDPRRRRSAPSADLHHYCPRGTSDFFVDYTDGGIHWTSSGWSITGGSRVSSKAAFNVLGGYIAFDIDLSGAHQGVNQNLYVSSLHKQNCGGACYCDAPTGCMELDFIEANGNCAYQSTWHTTNVGGQNCDNGGCAGVGKAKDKLHVHVDFSPNGWMRIQVGNDKWTHDKIHPTPADRDAAAIAATMKKQGVVLESSQWKGWVPGQCGDGSVAGSTFKISNLKVYGKVVNGPHPHGCTSMDLEDELGNSSSSFNPIMV